MKQIEFETEAEAIAFRDICDAAYPWEGKRGADEHAVLVEKHPTEKRWCAVVGVRLIPILEAANVSMPGEIVSRGDAWGLNTAEMRERNAELRRLKP